MLTTREPLAEVVPTSEDAYRYIAELCAELVELADRPGMEFVRYLLDMARIEAERGVTDRETTPCR